MLLKSPGDPSTTCEPLVPADGRDPEDRLVPLTPECIRDKMFDKTIADTFPTSDAPSTIPDPSADDSFATEEERRAESGLCSSETGKAA
jgi:hypothetical protein